MSTYWTVRCPACGQEPDGRGINHGQDILARAVACLPHIRAIRAIDPDRWLEVLILAPMDGDIIPFLLEHGDHAEGFQVVSEYGDLYAPGKGGIMARVATSGRALERLHAQWQEAHNAAEVALDAFVSSALAHLRLSGRGPEAALWEAQIALGHESRWRAAGYLAWQLGLDQESGARAPATETEEGSGAAGGTP